MQQFISSENRYDRPEGWFRNCGRSGLKLPAISLGCWHNFGEAQPGRGLDEHQMHQNCKKMLFTAFDCGITHFDLANNYGPPPGAAETRVGRILREDFKTYRDELIISTKAGHRMWPGPYGEFCSRKSLLSSLDQSLKRLQLDYVDIFYCHRVDAETPLEEIIAVLDTAVSQGKALYTGFSTYGPSSHSVQYFSEIDNICRANNYVRPIIHQPNYSMLDRWVEEGSLAVTAQFGLGVIAFAPLASGRLTTKYLKGIPSNSRIHQRGSNLQADMITKDLVTQVQKLNELAQRRGQTLAQMVLAWTLRKQGDTEVTSALIGASRPEQIEDCAKALNKGALTPEELRDIEAVLAS